MHPVTVMARTLLADQRGRMSHPGRWTGHLGDTPAPATDLSRNQTAS
jgi:hypothetical protein